MPDPAYWRRYVLELDPEEVERRLEVVPLRCGDETLELLHFGSRRSDPVIVISPGSAGHAYVFAELAYRIHARGFTALVMPKQGGRTISELVDRHDAALRAITARWNDNIGVFAEGLGGYVVFYVALGGGPMRSAIYQNAPAILDEPDFRAAVMSGSGSTRRAALLPIMRAAARVFPRMKLPISTYLDFREMVDPVEPTHAVETRLIESYLGDPDFDRRYPLAASLSLLDTPPPREPATLSVPTMFIVPSRGFAPDYARHLFARLPAIDKELVEVDGSVFWMVSHSAAAAELICGRFRRTLAAAAA